MSETQDHSKIKWIKDELDRVVMQARTALEDYTENDSESELIESCKQYLHQIKGTLQILELHGPTMLAEEMELVAGAIAAGTVDENFDEHAAETLMQGLVTMPDYLEKLQEGALDHPAIILPLINDLRIVRGEELLTEVELAAPELEKKLSQEEKVDEEGDSRLPRVAKRLRYKYHRCLLKWFYNNDPITGIEGLKVILERLHDVAGTGQVRSLFQVARAALAAPLEDLESPNTQIKLLFGKVDRELKRIIKEGERSVAETPTTNTMRDLLYHVAHVKEDDDLVKSVKKQFELDSLAISQQLVEQGRESLGLPTGELLDNLKDAISSDLAGIKDVLDLFIRTKNNDSGELQTLEDPMRKVADTLDMIGHGDLCQRMKMQAEKIHDIANAGAVVKESDLLEIAGDIVFVESSLENLSNFVKTQIIENTQILDPAKSGATETQLLDDGDRLPEGEFERLTDSVVREASVDMAKIKDAILAYINEPDKTQVLEKVPQHFYAIAGAFEMLKMFDISGLLRATAGYVSNELIANKVVPDTERLNAFADAITSVEYFMETIADGRGVQNKILDVAREALVRLGTENDVVDEEFYSSAEGEESIPGLIHDEDMGQSSELTLLDDAEDAVKFEEEKDVEVIQEHVPSAEKPSLDDIDPEILEIFIEEAREELEVIREYMGMWLDDLKDTESLITFRRSFHTLKGSGRLVGAKIIGELAWAIENMLNRVIDQTLDVSDEMTDLLNETVEVLPVLIDCQAEGVIPEVDVMPMVERAYNLATPDFAAASSSSNVVDLEIVESTAEEESEKEKGEESVDELVELTADIEADAEETIELEAVDIEADADEAIELEAAEKTDTEEEITLDPTLYEIFTAESQAHIGTINSFLEQCKEMGGVCGLDSEVSRAFHTLHGSAHMAGVDSIAELSSALEKYVNEMLEQDKATDSTTLRLIEDANEQFTTILQAINAPGSKIPDWRGLLSEIEATHLLIIPDEVEPDDSSEAQDTVEVMVDDLDDETIDLDLSDDLEEIELTAAEPELDVDQDAVTEEIELLDDVPQAVAALELEEESDSPESVTLDDLQDQDVEDESELTTELQPVEDEGEEPKAEPDIEPEEEESSNETAAAEEHEEDEIKSADDELVSIFLEESVELMDDVDHALAEWNNDPLSKNPVQELQRTLHTLKGGARLAGIPEIGDLSHAFESLIAAIDREKVDNSIEVRNFAQGVSDRLVSQIEEVSQGGQTQAADDVVADINAVISGQPLSAESQAEEEQEQVAQPEAEEAKPEEIELEPATEIKEVVEEVDLDESQNLVDESKLEDEAEVEQELEDIQEEIVLQEAEQEEDSGEILPFPETQEVPEELEGEQPPVEGIDLVRPVRRAGREYLRVNPDLMDKLVNNAGEVSIFRARLEQQSGSMGYSIDEMKNTVDRLREQLRKLDMETEAQILFRYERDKEEGRLGAEEFDPLELDRFSTLQQLSRGLMETVGDLANINKILETEQKDTETLLLQQSRITTDLQDGLMRTRMVSFNQLAPRLQRIVRQTCRPLNKQAELKIKGAGMELDRTILDRMTAPLEHLLRNAVSHGIEDPKKRKKKKKPEVGTITIDLARDGNDVVMTISDDGRGLDFKAIKERAKSKGLLLDDASASEGDLTQFILEHGFSTADSVSQIAGRGVGLDVVVSEVKQLGGTMEINSEPGSGTRFTIYLPLTLAITDALLLKASGEIYAAPYANVESVVRINRDELARFYEEGKKVYAYGENEYQMRYLGSLLGRGNPNLAEQKKRIPLLLVRAGKHRVAIHVDEIIGHRQIVVKSVGPQLSTIRWITGGTILGDGRVALILDMNALVRKDAAMTAEDVEAVQIAPAATSPDKIKIMVVDDSITVRKVTGRLLERNGMEVETAKDGVEALAMLQDYHPDIMLLDIEMPRMDGFEVARNMRSSEQLNDIPIIIITSRTGDKHRDHAMELGVKRYLGKPYQESDLLENIQNVLEESKQ